ncbi:hypothetical protein NFI96_022222 [Prochilodus magdalenae]|nr:hypothetical protein NFI96_022222 [Prochilodus magdalenae]
MWIIKALRSRAGRSALLWAWPLL